MNMGIDVGSTTVKVVVLTADRQVRFSSYGRHNAAVREVLSLALARAESSVGSNTVAVRITGSAGMGIAERTGIPFVQEADACAGAVRALFPEARTAIDVGGEDSKMIFLDKGRRADIRMNGACAAGTGAFLDQMAVLLDVPVAGLDELAARHQREYPIASRCGVFAKTDVQQLVSRQIPREDIAASVFHAVATQTKTTLARGRTIQAPVVLCGGPLSFCPSLRQAFLEVFGLSPDDVIVPDHAELVPAIGAALSDAEPLLISIAELRRRIEAAGAAGSDDSGALPPLFESEESFRQWSARRMRTAVPRVRLEEAGSAPCFLGIDSGSTTTKVVLLDGAGRIAFEHYAPNQGDPVGAVSTALQRLKAAADEAGVTIRIGRSCVTGYGEDLIRAAFRLDEGLVETLSHQRAATAFHPEASLILDVGGQDMKAIFIEQGAVRSIEINEACSSGCGSFLQTFAESLGMGMTDFAAAACRAPAPCDLGSRCTVFMNSRVKQALREGASPGDIAAGLAYSVIRNCLQKVLRITDTRALGDVVVVQGGTFRNAAVHRALEQIIGKPVVCPDIPELMGAYGAALTALESFNTAKADLARVPVPLAQLARVPTFTTKRTFCRGCDNRCSVGALSFEGGGRFFTGHKCETVFSNGEGDRGRGRNLVAAESQLVFEGPLVPAGPPRLTIGIPRVLGMYEQFPFWRTLFVECGLAVRLSPPSTAALFESGAGTVMSDNICVPAKLAHGHVRSLIEAGVDRVFFPMVFKGADHGKTECWNCPIVAAYADVIRSAVDPEGHGVPFDTPTMSWHDPSLLARACRDYLASLGVDGATFRRAFPLALRAQEEVKRRVREQARQLIEKAAKSGRPLVVLAGRPYHLDPLVNHRIPEILAGLGVDVLTADAIAGEPAAGDAVLPEVAHWNYPDRLYHAARWVAQHPNVELVQLSSFGCGPDAITTDEVKAILGASGRRCTLLRIDEMTGPGAARLRLRTMLETRNPASAAPRPATRRRPSFERKDRARTLLVPHLSPFHSPFIPAALATLGYHAEVLPPPDRESASLGLRYTNNDICYPAILVIGDAIKALAGGRYRPEEVAILLTQTGGQCRASNYVPLMKKALAAAGFGKVPVVAAAVAAGARNDQPGFRLNMPRMLRIGFWSVVAGDALMRLFYATAAREVRRGTARELARTHAARTAQALHEGGPGALESALDAAVRDFNQVAVVDNPLPRLGIVGEIYVKYVDYANNHLVDWLHARGVEAEMPPMLDFFLQWFVNTRWSPRLHLVGRSPVQALVGLFERTVVSRLRRIEDILSGFRRYQPRDSIHSLAARAARVLSLADQFGEGWLVPGEVSTLAERGVEHVVCLQPFGCIANHVVGKGVESRLRELYPDLDLLYLDLDPGVGEVNLFNRLHFMVEGARRSVKRVA